MSPTHRSLDVAQEPLDARHRLLRADDVAGVVVLHRASVIIATTGGQELRQPRTFLHALLPLGARLARHRPPPRPTRRRLFRRTPRRPSDRDAQRHDVGRREKEQVRGGRSRQRVRPGG